MLLTTERSNGIATLSPDLAEHHNGDSTGTATLAPDRHRASYATNEAAVQPALALFCYEGPGGDVARFIDRFAGPLCARGVALHVFSRRGLELDAPGTLIHVLGDGGEGSLIDRVGEFAHRACNAFLKQFSGSATPVTVMGCEWSAVPALSILRGVKNLNTVLSLHSLEWQRSGMDSDLSRRIADLELSGLREARLVLTHDEATADAIREWTPDFADRVTPARPTFPVEDFAGEIDAGAVKARYQVGPTDPLLLCVGDLDERYGPDLLLKAMPAVLKQHPQARLVIVGDGALQWPLRVYARYLLLEHAVRLPGHVEGEAMSELVRAADAVVVPSRDSTPWWPIQAAWAARRPVVATHEAAPELLDHERDAVLVYPETPSCAWGIDRVLSDAELAGAIAERGGRKLRERFGWDAVAAQVIEAMGAR